MPLLPRLIRLHQALLPDYNRRASIYWWTVAPLGLIAIGHALWVVSGLPAVALTQVAVGVMLAVLAAYFPIVLPRTATAFAAGEIFVFLLLLSHGVEAAVLAAAVEAGVATWRVSRRWSSRIASPALGGLSMQIAGLLLMSVLGELGRLGVQHQGVLVMATLWFAVVHFIINTLLVGTLPRLKRGEWPSWSDLAGNFGITAAVSAGSAAGAALLTVSFRDSGVAVILVVGPPLALVVGMLHAFFKQQEAYREISEAAAQSARREAEITARHLQEMHHIAFHDALTALPNRRRFVEELSRAVQTAREQPESGFAVMFFDFDRFKVINDSLGHAAGDDFLIEVSRRISSRVRPNDLVARLGGDEFAVLVRGARHIEGIEELATRMQEAVSQPYIVAGTEVRSSASIGITSSSHGYDRPGDVLRDADIAMYRAKAAGKARHTVFDAGMHAEVARRLRLESDLRRALAEGQVGIAYQPIVELGSGRLLGFEALARWTHPELGPVRPDEFIPIAEESALIVELTDSVLARACRQLRRWQSQDPCFAELFLHVNVSDRDVAQRNLVARVKRELFESCVQPRHLTLELTEAILMHRLSTERGALEELRAFGVRLSIDDFGVGYSSLAHLSTLPIDSLKIDRSFVSRLGLRADDASIVRTILNLGRSLDKTVIAEGVETAEQLETLRQLGCHIGQGYQMHTPLSVQAVDALLERLVAPPVVPAAEILAEPQRLFH